MGIRQFTRLFYFHKDICHIKLNLNLKPISTDRQRLIQNCVNKLCDEGKQWAARCCVYFGSSVSRFLPSWYIFPAGTQTHDTICDKLKCKETCTMLFLVIEFSQHFYNIEFLYLTFLLNLDELVACQKCLLKKTYIFLSVEFVICTQYICFCKYLQTIRQSSIPVARFL